MSSREKKLLTLLLLAVLVVGVLLLYKRVYEPRYQQAKLKLTNAEQQIQNANAVSQSKDLVEAEQNWLSENEPAPESQQKAQSDLQNFCEQTTKRFGLEVKSETLLEAVTPLDNFYHRVRIDLLVSGKEKEFYNWLVTLDNPEIFQRVTSLRLNPNKSDNTLIEAKVVVDKWFTPTSN